MKVSESTPNLSNIGIWIIFACALLAWALDSGFKLPDIYSESLIFLSVMVYALLSLVGVYNGQGYVFWGPGLNTPIKPESTETLALFIVSYSIVFLIMLYMLVDLLSDIF